MKRLTMSALFIIRMNRASLTIDIDGQAVFISRKVFNILLEQRYIDYQLIKKTNPKNASMYTWVAVLSAF